MNFIRNVELALLRTPECETHSFCGGGSFVEKGCIGNIHSSEVLDHGLEIEQRLEPALSDLSLVRSVLRRPLERVTIQNEFDYYPESITTPRSH